MHQRVERVAAEIQQVLGAALVRGEIRDPRVQAAGLITFTHVRLTRDLRDAHVLFIVHEASPEVLESVRAGLTSAAGHLRRLLGRELRLRTTPNLSFEIDQVFDQEAKIDALLKEVGELGHVAPTGDGGGEPPKR
jgi:ribosome-binding factor A